MYTVITILIILTCVLLVLVVLVQNPKGGGISAGIIGSNQVMGVKKTTDFIEKLTWGLMFSLILLCLGAGMVLPNKETTGVGTNMQEQIDNAATAPKQTMPAQKQPAAQPTGQQPAQPTPAPSTPGK